MQSHVEAVKALPEAIQNALRKVGYGRRDIAIHVRETASRQCLGGEGRKGFCVIGNLTTGEVSDVAFGSWGGANVFTPGNAVDNDSAEYPIPADAFVVNGSQGYDGTYATITIGPVNAARLLTAATSDVTPRESEILGACGYLSAYKKARLAEMQVTPAEIDALVARGFLARNKAGATSLTTAGKNIKARVF